MLKMLSFVASAAFVAAAFFQSIPAGAAELGVTPVTFTLAKGASSGMLTVENRGSDPVRLQVSVTSWSMNPQGEMQVKPTDDIVAFPGLVTLMPSEKRVIRFGIVNNPPSETEKTYRIFLHELPSLESSLGEKNGATFSVHTTFGIPIFIPPSESVKHVSVSALNVAGGHVRVIFANTGTVHTSVSEIRIAGTDNTGRTVFLNVQHGWYVLANNDRVFDVKLQHPDCAKLANVTATVYSDAGTVSKSLSVPSGSCR